MSLQSTEEECAANAVAPRVTLASMEANIAARYDFIAGDAISAIPLPAIVPTAPLDLLSICILQMKNGFCVIGKSAPASAANFNAELGKKLAYEDAIRQLWPLEGYQLRTQMAAGQ